jgi:hypothetical protein
MNAVSWISGMLIAGGVITTGISADKGKEPLHCSLYLVFDHLWFRPRMGCWKPSLSSYFWLSLPLIWCTLLLSYSRLTYMIALESIPILVNFILIPLQSSAHPETHDIDILSRLDCCGVLCKVFNFLYI